MLVSQRVCLLLQVVKGDKPALVLFHQQLECDRCDDLRARWVGLSAAPGDGGAQGVLLGTVDCMGPKGSRLCQRFGVGSPFPKVRIIPRGTHTSRRHVSGRGV